MQIGLRFWCNKVESHEDSRMQQSLVEQACTLWCCNDSCGTGQEVHKQKARDRLPCRAGRTWSTVHSTLLWMHSSYQVVLGLHQRISWLKAQYWSYNSSSTGLAPSWVWGTTIWSWHRLRYDQQAYLASWWNWQRGGAGWLWWQWFQCLRIRWRDCRTVELPDL